MSIRTFLARKLPVALVFLACTAAADAGFNEECEAIGKDLSKQMSGATTGRVAVLDLADLKGEVSDLGRLLTGELTATLVTNAKGIEVVDRANLQAIIAEHKLTMSGLVEPENAKKLGKLAGVTAIIVGTAVPLGGRVRITLRAIATDSAKILAAVKGEILSVSAIKELLPAGFKASEAGQTKSVNAGRSAKPAQSGRREQSVAIEGTGSRTTPRGKPSVASVQKDDDGDGAESEETAIPAADEAKTPEDTPLRGASGNTAPAPRGAVEELRKGATGDSSDLKVTIDSAQFIGIGSTYYTEIVLVVRHRNSGRSSLCVALNAREGRAADGSEANDASYVTSDTGARLTMVQASGVKSLTGGAKIIGPGKSVTSSWRFLANDLRRQPSEIALHSSHLLLETNASGVPVKDSKGQPTVREEFDVSVAHKVPTRQ